jgi:2-polyprenyl-6-methoxyphenol hydroxylase-like FAD-dependent oxidoreductase
VKVVCVGGGPAGLYLSILLQQRDDGPHDITVLERDGPESTYGWGVVFWEDLLQKLHQHDSVSATQISDAAFHWDTQALQVGGQQIRDSTSPGYSIRRQLLLDILRRRATDLGVRIEFEREVTELSALPDADLVVIGDGAKSRLRDSHTDRFSPQVHVGRNKYIWLGTTKVFKDFSFLFVETPAGWLWSHAYGIDDQSSTFIVECAPETWSRLGFADSSTSETIAVLEDIFGRHLDGHDLMSQARHTSGSAWLNFRTITNENWHWDNKVLVGDAAHTTHFSIGSGTRLAVEDAIALARGLERHGDTERALPAYETERIAALVQAQSDAQLSARWFESVPRYTGLQPEKLFALLCARRSPLLPRVPPSLYYRLHEQAEENAVLRRLRTLVGSRTRALHRRMSLESSSR